MRIAVSSGVRCRTTNAFTFVNVVPVAAADADAAAAAITSASSLLAHSCYKKMLKKMFEFSFKQFHSYEYKGLL